jgi:hypothetical protein
LAVCVSALQGESVDVAPSRTAKGRSYRQAMRVTRAGQEGTCVFCGEKFGQRHVLGCPEWAAEVETEEVVMCRAVATHGQVGTFYGHAGEGAPSWRSGRGWPSELVMAKAACTVPSMMALSPGQQDETLAVLVEWAALATKRPYPLEVIGRGLGRTSPTTTSTWRKKDMRVRVVCEIAGP